MTTQTSARSSPRAATSWKRWTRCSDEIRQSGEFIATEPLADPVQTKTVRPGDGLPVVTDGPLAETKEHFGEYLVVDCETRERAVEIAQRWPSARFAPIEVRPILDVGGSDL